MKTIIRLLKKWQGLAARADDPAEAAKYKWALAGAAFVLLLGMGHATDDKHIDEVAFNPLERVESAWLAESRKR